MIQISRRGHRAGLAAAAVALSLPATLAAALPASAADGTPAVVSTSVSPATITAGDQAIQTVRLSAPAPEGGLGVEVLVVGRSDRAYAYSTDTYVRVPAGQTSVSFPIRLDAYPSKTVVPLVAGRDGSEATTDVTVTPPDWREQTVERIDLEVPGDSNAVIAGTKATGTVQLKAPAKPGGTSVDLRAEHISGLPTSPEPKMPPYAVVPAGSTRGTFTLEHPGVPVQGIGITDIAADLGHTPMRATALLAPKDYTLGVVRTLRRGPYARNLGAVGLGNRWHPFGAVIELTSQTPGVTVPKKLEIPADQAGTSFPITVDATVPVGTEVKISAKWVLSTAGTVTTTARVDE
ncbi:MULTISPECIES: hypothetical protein [Actinomadura]|uniref:NPCBM-associated, NEW3 domain of alpha-galactosidase n=1 Tax=Actinomadura yumaensis TaxID=111807 RepID=A0ABW2CJQ7_9ACTN|nr:hypothetical protein [Actinomadura sp. J1-007]MWK38533.1 hypothetical protein [Actinomadura sp. J1-007]